MYYHFAGKAELVEALITDRLRPLIIDFNVAAEANKDDPRGAIEALVRAELEFLSSQGSFSKLLLTEMWREDRLWRETLVLLRRELITVISTVIEQGIRTGDFRSDIDPDFGASALFGMTATVALDWLAFDPDQPLEDLVRQITKVAFNAVRPI